jgi:hypothetical protein
METQMSKLERFSAALIAVALFATPAMARKQQPKSWHDKNGAYIHPSRVVHTGLAYNLTRVMNIVGIKPLITAVVT